MRSKALIFTLAITFLTLLAGCDNKRLVLAPSPTSEPTQVHPTSVPRYPSRVPTTTPTLVAPTVTPSTSAPPPTSSPTTVPPTPTVELDPISLIDPSGQEVVFWHVYTKEQERLLLELTEEFNKTNEWHITVRAEYAGYFGDIRQKILDSLAAGMPPDLAIAFPNQVAEYQQYGVVEPLDDYIGSVQYGLTSDDLADIFSTILESDRYPTYENRLLSFPPSRSMEVLYYNRDWLETLGYEAPPKTWEQFRNLCITASEDSDRDGIRDTHGYALDVNHYVLENWIWSNGGKMTSDNYEQVAFHNTEGVAALTFLTELVSSGYACQVAKRYDDQSAFAAQKVLFTTGTSAGIPYYAQAITDPKTKKPRFHWAVAPIPYNTAEPVVVIHGPSIVVFKSTSQRQLASWLFIRWFTQPENNARWAMAANYFPIRKSALAMDVMQDYIKNNPAYATAAEFLSYAQAEPRLAAWYQVQELLADAMHKALSGAKTPKQALDDAARNANGLLSQ